MTTYSSKGTKPVGAGRYRCSGDARVAFNWLIVHTSEQSIDSDRTNDAEALCAFLATRATEDNVASYNAVADTDGWYDLVADQCRAFAAPPTNGTALHICLPVRMKGMTRQTWLSAAVRPFIDVAASWTVTKARLHGIPLEQVSANEMSTGRRGYADHWTVSRAFGKTDHTDCGTEFPWDAFGAEVIRQSTVPRPPPKPYPIPPPPVGEDTTVIVIVAPQGTNARFLATSDGKGFISSMTWIPNETAMKRLSPNYPVQTIAVASCKDIGLIGPVPHGDTLRDWEPEDFLNAT